MDSIQGRKHVVYFTEGFDGRLLFGRTPRSEDPQFQARGAFSDAVHPEAGAFRQVAPALAGMPRAEGPVEVPDGAVTNTDALLAAAKAQGAPVSRCSVRVARGTG